MKLYLPVVECAIEHNQKFLVIEHPSGKYSEGLLSFPGGKIDAEDEAYTTDILRASVKREVFEEVGLILEDDIDYVFSSYFVGKNNTPILNSTFYCKLIKSDPTVTISPKEVANYLWLSPEEILSKANSSEWLKSYLILIQQYKASRGLK